MPITIRREALALLGGDIAFLTFSLWATLLVRTFDIPKWETFYAHVVPFLFLFLLSVLIFFIAGLYEKHTLLFKSSLPETIFYAQIGNIIAGALFFFMIPYFGIQPKTNLFIYLFFSTTFVSAWRIYIFPLLKRGRITPALIFGEGDECVEIHDEINNNSRYAIRFVSSCQSLEGNGTALEIERAVRRYGAPVVVMPFSSVHLPKSGSSWDSLAVSGIRFTDTARLYEELFDRVALPLLTNRWFFEENVRAEVALYTVFKRVMDIVVSLIALIVLTPVIALIALTLFVFDGGRPFIFQPRVGRGGKEISIAKFRTMLFDDGGDPKKQKLNRITSFGSFLRKTRLDELPQFWNVLWGDLSLIGPRPEIRSLVEEYEKLIPFYNARFLMQPGISGWAQIKHASPPKFSLDVEATKEKLSYDLYYLKHRSLMLDMSIALRTVKILLSWVGR